MTDDKTRKQVRQRWTSGEEIPPSPVLRRQARRPAAGADTPAGPFTTRNIDEVKQDQEQQAEEDNDQSSEAPKK